MAEPQQLGAFLAAQGRKLVKAKPCERIELAHISIEGAKVTCSQFELPETLNDISAAELAALIYQAALDHASGYPLLQQYAVLLFWPDAEAPGASHMMRCQGSQSLGYGMSEPPNAVGSQAQLMRHIEAQARTNMLLTEKLAARLDRELERKEKRIAELEAERIKGIELLELLASKAHEREIGKIQAEAQEKRRDDGYRQLTLLVPNVVNAVCTKLGVPALAAGGIHPTIVGVKNWMKSLTHDQLLRVLASCDAAQQVALLAAYQELAVKEEYSDLVKAAEGGSTEPH